MKTILIILTIIANMYAFEVEFTKIYSKYITPHKKAILILTKDNNLTFPFHYRKIKNGYLLYGDIDQINMWLNNNFYTPNDAKFKTVNFDIVNMDKFQYEVIKKLSSTYKKCKIKNLIFLTPDENKIIFKPQNVELKYKVILNCK